MILTCPECATSYFVDDDRVPPEGRTVRCSACGVRWSAKPEPPEAVEAAEPEPLDIATADAPEPVAEEPPLRLDEAGADALPRAYRAKVEDSRKTRQAMAAGVVWAGLAAAFALVLGAAVIFRVDVVRLWPRAASAYAGVGLPVNSLGLAIEGVRAEPSLEEGHAALSITGMIRNIEDKAVVAPALKISLLAKDDRPLVTRIARPADPRVPPGETRHFAITILDPPATAQSLEVSFDPAAVGGHGEAAGGHGAKAEPERLSLRPAQHTAPAAPPHPESAAHAEPAGPEPVEAVPLPPDSPDALHPHE